MAQVRRNSSRPHPARASRAAVGFLPNGSVFLTGFSHDPQNVMLACWYARPRVSVNASQHLHWPEYSHRPLPWHVVYVTGMPGAGVDDDVPGHTDGLHAPVKAF